jgi:hypothetical protein
LAQGLEDFSELLARVAAEGVVVHGQGFGLVFEFGQPLGQVAAPTPSTHTPQQLRGKHLTFWGEQEVQEFWSGNSFLRTDDGNLLSYALARLIVEQMSREWDPFMRFVLAADGVDAGAAAAGEHLDVDLGEFVCALLEKAPSLVWAPDPSKWGGAPERGRFALSAVR